MGDLGWDGDYCEVPRCRRWAASIYGPSVDGRVRMRISSAEERGTDACGGAEAWTPNAANAANRARPRDGQSLGASVSVVGCDARLLGTLVGVPVPGPRPSRERPSRGSAPAEDLPSIRGSRCTPRAALRQTIFAFQTSAFPFRLGSLHAPGASRSLARLPTRPHPPASRARAASRTDRRVCADVVVLLRTISHGQRATRQSARISTHRSRKAPPRLPSS